MNTPKQYEFLKLDDIIHEGDEALDENSRWTPAKRIGCRVSIYNEKQQHYRRPVAAADPAADPAAWPRDGETCEEAFTHPGDATPCAAGCGCVTEPAAAAPGDVGEGYEEVTSGVATEDMECCEIDEMQWQPVRGFNGDKIGSDNTIGWRFRRPLPAAVTEPAAVATEVPGGVWSKDGRGHTWTRMEDGGMKDSHTGECASRAWTDKEMRSTGWTLTLPEAAAAPEPAAQPVAADTVAARCLAEMEARIKDDMAQLQPNLTKMRNALEEEYEARRAKLSHDARDLSFYQKGYAAALSGMRAALKAAGSPATEAAQ